MVQMLNAVREGKRILRRVALRHRLFGSTERDIRIIAIVVVRLFLWLLLGGTPLLGGAIGRRGRRG